MTRWTEGGIGKRERDGSVCDRDILARIINPHADRYVVESIPESSLLSASPAREKPRLSMGGICRGVRALFPGHDAGA